MATRFAGDFFGIPLTTSEEKDSVLIDYYPELKTVKKSSAATQEVADSGARTYGGAKAAPIFSGFREFEASDNEPKAAPLFTGFKSYRTPAK